MRRGEDMERRRGDKERREEDMERRREDRRELISGCNKLMRRPPEVTVKQ